jgi:hypothetical protein
MAWLMLTGRAQPSTVSTTETRMKRMTNDSNNPVMPGGVLGLDRSGRRFS